MFITFTIIFNVFFFEVLFQISSLHTSPPRDDVLTCSSKITLNSFQSHIRWLMEAARDSIKGCSAVRSVQQRVRTGERAGGMLVCSLVTMRVAVGGGRVRGVERCRGGRGRWRTRGTALCIREWARLLPLPLLARCTVTCRASPGIFEEAGIYGGKGIETRTPCVSILR